MSHANYVLALKDEIGEMYILYLSREKHEKAVSNQLYAAILLEKYKRAIEMQLHNTQQSDLVVSDIIPSNLQPLKMIEAGVVYNLLVTEEEVMKSEQDEIFRKNLLEDHKNKYFNVFNESDGLSKRNNVETPPESEEDNVEFNLASNKKGKNKNLPKKQGESHQPCVWKDDEALLLLSLYSKYQKSYDNGQMTHLKFWRLIMEGLDAENIHKSRQQAISKMESLKKSYKKTKDANKQSGSGTDNSCAYYEILDEMFSKKPWIKPISVAGNSMPLGDISNESTSPPCKKMKLALNQAKLQYFEDAITNRQLKREEKAKYNERKLQILEKLVESLKK